MKGPQKVQIKLTHNQIGILAEGRLFPEDEWKVIDLYKYIEYKRPNWNGGTSYISPVRQQKELMAAFNKVFNCELVDELI